MTDQIRGRALADLDARAAQLAPMLGDGDVRVRKSTVVALGKMPCPAAAGLLCRALDDADVGVGVLACQALGRLADPACLGAVLAHAHDESPQMRAGVLWVLANVAAHGGLDGASRSELFAPIVLLAFDPDDGVRADAAAVLGTIPDARCVDPLLVLAEDDDPRTRANAMASLGLVGGARGEEVLLACIEAAGNGESQAALPVVSALDALARRAERGEAQLDDGRAGRVVDATLALAKGAADPDVRATAIWAAGLVGPLVADGRHRAVRLLAEVVRTPGEGEDWPWRYAVESLSRIGGDEATQVLVDARERLSSGETALAEQSVALLDQALDSLAAGCA